MNKNELRKILHEKRNTLYAADKFTQLTKQLQNNIINSSAYKNSKILCSYASTKSEPDTSLIAEAAWKDKKIVLFPLCSKTTKGIMHFYQCNNFSDLETGAYNISEPKPHCPLFTEEILNTAKTLVLVPALSFSSKGYRLGYGQGFYDRFLAKIPNSITMGVTLTELIQENIPVEPWDIAVQYLATEHDIIKI